jgi:hypothetical protein
LFHLIFFYICRIFKLKYMWLGYDSMVESFLSMWKSLDLTPSTTNKKRKENNKKFKILH